MNLKKLRLVLKTLGEDTRLRIVNILRNRELTVKDICSILNLNQPAVSKHLARMRLLKIVIDRREGNLIYYRLNTESDQGKIIRYLFSEFKEIPELKKDMERSKKTRGQPSQIP